MPNYLFTNSRTGETIERTFPVADHPKAIRHKGKKYRINVAAQIAGTKKTTGGRWPIESDALGVTPSQIPEMKAHLERHGVKADFDPKTGCCIVRNNGHRNALMKARGFVDTKGYGGIYG